MDASTLTPPATKPMPVVIRRLVIREYNQLLAVLGAFEDVGPDERRERFMNYLRAAKARFAQLAALVRWLHKHKETGYSSLTLSQRELRSLGEKFFAQAEITDALFYIHGGLHFRRSRRADVPTALSVLSGQGYAHLPGIIAAANRPWHVDRYLSSKAPRQSDIAPLLERCIREKLLLEGAPPEGMGQRVLRDGMLHVRVDDEMALSLSVDITEAAAGAADGKLGLWPQNPDPSAAPWLVVRARPLAGGGEMLSERQMLILCDGLSSSLRSSAAAEDRCAGAFVSPALQQLYYRAKGFCARLGLSRLRSACEALCRDPLWQQRASLAVSSADGALQAAASKAHGELKRFHVARFRGEPFDIGPRGADEWVAEKQRAIAEGTERYPFCALALWPKDAEGNAALRLRASVLPMRAEGHGERNARLVVEAAPRWLLEAGAEEGGGDGDGDGDGDGAPPRDPQGAPPRDPQGAPPGDPQDAPPRAAPRFLRREEERAFWASLDPQHLAWLDNRCSKKALSGPARFVADVRCSFEGSGCFGLALRASSVDCDAAGLVSLVLRRACAAKLRLLESCLQDFGLGAAAPSLGLSMEALADPPALRLRLLKVEPYWRPAPPSPPSIGVAVDRRSGRFRVALYGAPAGEELQGAASDLEAQWNDAFDALSFEKDRRDRIAYAERLRARSHDAAAATFGAPASSIQDPVARRRLGEPAALRHLCLAMAAQALRGCAAQALGLAEAAGARLRLHGPHRRAPGAAEVEAGALWPAAEAEAGRRRHAALFALWREGSAGEALLAAAMASARACAQDGEPWKARAAALWAQVREREADERHYYLEAAIVPSDDADATFAEQVRWRLLVLFAAPSEAQLQHPPGLGGAGAGAGGGGLTPAPGADGPHPPGAAAAAPAPAFVPFFKRQRADSGNKLRAKRRRKEEDAARLAPAPAAGPPEAEAPDAPAVRFAALALPRPAAAAGAFGAKTLRRSPSAEDLSASAARALADAQELLPSARLFALLHGLRERAGEAPALASGGPLREGQWAALSLGGGSDIYISAGGGDWRVALPLGCAAAAGAVCVGRLPAKQAPYRLAVRLEGVGGAERPCALWAASGGPGLATMLLAPALALRDGGLSASRALAEARAWPGGGLAPAVLLPEQAAVLCLQEFLRRAVAPAGELREGAAWVATMSTLVPCRPPSRERGAASAPLPPSFTSFAMGLLCREEPRRSGQLAGLRARVCALAAMLCALLDGAAASGLPRLELSGQIRSQMLRSSEREPAPRAPAGDGAAADGAGAALERNVARWAFERGAHGALLWALDRDVVKAMVVKLDGQRSAGARGLALRLRGAHIEMAREAPWPRTMTDKGVPQGAWVQTAAEDAAFLDTVAALFY